MLSTSLRTVPRVIPRAHLPIPLRSRSYASFPPYTPPPNTSGRTITLLALAVAGLGGGAYYLSQQGRGVIVQLLPPHGLDKHPSESVLAQKSLKEPGLHSSDGPSKAAKSVGAAAAKKVEGGSSVSAATPPQTPSAVTDSAAKVSNPSEGAFNEETGEINWDCPCLGGMADGPCGEQFKAAFSCFVFSEAEPKGMDCVDKFKNMQDCFREHPDVYGEELEDDDEEATQPGESLSDPPAHPIPGNPIGDTRTPRQRAEGVPAQPKEIPPENSQVFTATPDNSPKKGPKHIE